MNFTDDEPSCPSDIGEKSEQKVTPVTNIQPISADHLPKVEPMPVHKEPIKVAPIVPRQDPTPVANVTALPKPAVKAPEAPSFDLGPVRAQTSSKQMKMIQLSSD